jgi:magnesium transporter
VPALLRPRLRPLRAGSARSGTGGASAEPTTPDIIDSSGIRWLDLERPREADREWLEKEFGFHPACDRGRRVAQPAPKLDAYDDYLFLVLHFGVFDKVAGRLLTVELDVFVGPDFVITLPDGPLPPIAAMFERYRQNDELRESVFSKGPGYLLYKIVDTAVDASFPQLRRMGEKLDRLEDDIFEAAPPRSSGTSRT